MATKSQSIQIKFSPPKPFMKTSPKTIKKKYWVVGSIFIFWIEDTTSRIEISWRGCNFGTGVSLYCTVTSNNYASTSFTRLSSISFIFIQTLIQINWRHEWHDTKIAFEFLSRYLNIYARDCTILIALTVKAYIRSFINLKYRTPSCPLCMLTDRKWKVSLQSAILKYALSSFNE